jgi:hypothetical protein
LSSAAIAAFIAAAVADVSNFYYMHDYLMQQLLQAFTILAVRRIGVQYLQTQQHTRLAANTTLLHKHDVVAMRRV